MASNSNNIGEAIALGLISHFFLDSIPHVEYKIENIKKGDLKIAAKEFTKIFVDLLLGLIIVLYLIQNKNFDQSILMLTGAFFGILPDGLVFLNHCVKNKDKNVFSKFLKIQTDFHNKIHSSVTAKIITISSQALIIIILVIALWRS